MKINEMNPAVLAYIGDAVYEQKIREYIVKLGIGNVNDLQKKAVEYVSCLNQAKILDNLLLQQIFTENELYTISRAKNYKPKSKPNHAKIVDYKKATALEALFGMLYLEKNYERINYIFERIIGE